MSDRLLFILTFLSAMGSGLVAGAFFAFSTFVMKALSKLPAAQGVAAMQSINVVVINPWFMGLLFGTAAACAAVGVGSVLRWQEPGAGWRVTGALLYLIGTIGVTIAFNVPRNDALAAVNPTTTDAARAWTDYLQTWTTWNHVRTIAAMVAMACFVWALVASREG